MMIRKRGGNDDGALGAGRAGHAAHHVSGKTDAFCFGLLPVVVIRYSFPWIWACSLIAIVLSVVLGIVPLG